MIDWIYERESQEVNGQIKLSMFTLTKMLQEKAAESHVEDYRARRKNNYAATLGEYSTTINFKREDEEYDKIKKFYTEKKDAELATIKAWPAYIGFGVAVAALIGCFFVGFGLLVLTLGGAGYGAFKLLSNKSHVKQCEQKCEEGIKATSETMSKLFAEFKQYNKELDEYDAYYEQIKDAFAKI